jgi:hypothetical protein
MRRNRSWNAALSILGIALLLLLGSCKKADEVAPTPQAITINFEVIDHMTGVVGMTLTKNGFVGTSMTITTAETEIAGVVADFISIWDPAARVVLNSSKTGTVAFTPSASTQLQVIRFHNGDGHKEVYDWLAAQNSLHLYAGRESTWSRLDEAGVTGNESVWTGTDGVFTQVKQILNNPFKVGDVTTIASGGQNKYGFWNSLGGDGGNDLSQRLVYVSPAHLPTDISQIRVGVIELVEYLGAFNNIFSKPTSLTFMDAGGYVANDKCEAGLRFIFAYCK